LVADWQHRLQLAHLCLREESRSCANERDFFSGKVGPGQGVGALAIAQEGRPADGQFVADIRLGGLQDVAFVRSPLLMR